MEDAEKRPKITVFGHRGARGIFPENTMEGFRYLRDIGINAVEIDVQNAADRVTVVAHDPHIFRAITRDENGEWVDGENRLIRHTTQHEIDHLNVGTIRAGTDYAARFPDQARLKKAQIPTFATFCEWAATHPDLLLNVEIKSDATNPELTDPPAVIASDVISHLEHHGLTERAILSSFDWRVVHACAARAPDVARGYLTLMQNHGTQMVPNIVDGSLWMDGKTRADYGNSLPQTIAKLGGQVWCPYFEDLTLSDLRHAQNLGLCVNVWTVNDVTDINRMVAMGVDGIISDYPARVENILARTSISC